MGIAGKLTIRELMESSYKLTDKVLSDLEDGFKNDFTVEESCLFAGIRKDTFYNWLKLSDEFAERIDKAKQFVSIAAKRNIAQAVITHKSVEDAWKYLERRQKKLYSQRTEQDITSGNKPIPLLGGLTNVSNNNNASETSETQEED